MIKTPFDPKTKILFGNDLRTLLSSEHISYGEVSTLLKKKGVFTGDRDKAETVPLLVSTLLTPSEFGELLEKSVSRESTPKMKFSTYDLCQTNDDWMGCVRDLDFTGINLDFFEGRAELIADPHPIITDGGKVRIPYRIKRTDYSRDLLERELEFDGELLLEQGGGELTIEVSSTHTSRETEQLNRRIASHVARELKHANLISNEKEKAVAYKSFTNTQRIKFFKKLVAGDPTMGLLSGEVNDIEVFRDFDAGDIPDVPEISWMRSNVKGLKVDGDQLNDFLLISKEEYYQYIGIQKLNVTYAYAHGANTGKIRVMYYFEYVNRGDNKEFTELTFTSSISPENNTNIDARKEIIEKMHKAIRGVVDRSHQSTTTISQQA
jgi:hypothetical protein